MMFRVAAHLRRGSGRGARGAPRLALCGLTVAKALAESLERLDKAKVAKAAIKPWYYKLEELKEFTGEDGMPIYIGVLDEINVVSAKRKLYGPGERYHLFAGRYASRALACMAFNDDFLNNPTLEDITDAQRKTLGERDRAKCPVVGKLVQ